MATAVIESDLGGGVGGAQGGVVPLGQPTRSLVSELLCDRDASRCQPSRAARAWCLIGSSLISGSIALQ